MIVVDRIEGDRAILVIGQEQVEVPSVILPEGTVEGAILELHRRADLEAKTLEEARARLERLQARDDLPDEIEL